MFCIFYYNEHEKIKEKLKHFQINSLRVQLKSTISSVWWEAPKQKAKVLAATELIWSWSSAQLTCAFSSSHTHHTCPEPLHGCGSQRDRLTRKVEKTKAQKGATLAQTRLDARCPPPGAACVCVCDCGCWCATLKQAQTAGKTPAAAPAAPAAAVAGWEGSPHLSVCQPRSRPLAIP